LGISPDEPTPRVSQDGTYSNRNLAPLDTTNIGGTGVRIRKNLSFTSSNDADPRTNVFTASSPTNLYTSTTDDEDMLSMTAPLQKPTDSYFPSVVGATSLPRRRSQKPQHSPLSLSTSTLPHPSSPQFPEHDYAETERWGYLILFTTWIVFVVGMGSCFGVWSWAWDVGETPYAPPELEDDPTLPITGYYPALMVLTMVMAWVWVGFAWVGMKYFRHAMGGAE
jgi:hypothetical protein